MSFPEFGWTQSFSGSAPDIGAYENGTLVEGPAFRFRIPPGVTLPYLEKPRIVRCSINKKVLTINFSEKVDPSTISVPTVQIFNGNDKETIKSVENINGYAVTVTCEREIDPANVSLSFTTMPRGANGESATYWGSAINIHYTKH